MSSYSLIDHPEQMVKDKRIVIAIDGPSGAGKSTLGRRLARELDLLYIDTGAMYRAVALAVTRAGINTADHSAVTEVARLAKIRLEGDPDSLHVWLDDSDVTDEIRGEQVGHTASIVSAITGVRRELVRQQRELGQRASGAVLDGRDIGTVVFPDADLKFFLTAVPEERARRRFEELRAHDQTFEETLADITSRDHRDSTREDSPLVMADDAIVIDTTGLSIDEVFQRMMEAANVVSKRTAVSRQD